MGYVIGVTASRLRQLSFYINLFKVTESESDLTKKGREIRMDQSYFNDARSVLDDLVGRLAQNDEDRMITTAIQLVCIL